MARLSDNIRETTWRVLALALVAAIGASLTLNFLGGQPVVRHALDAAEQATSGLVQEPLIASPFFFAIMAPVIFGVGRLLCTDVGWRLSTVSPALWVTLAFWVVMQPAAAVWVVFRGGQLRWNEAWNELGAG